MFHAKNRVAVATQTRATRSSLRSRALAFAFVAVTVLGVTLPARQALNATRAYDAAVAASGLATLHHRAGIGGGNAAMVAPIVDEFRLNELELKYFGQQTGF